MASCGSGSQRRPGRSGAPPAGHYDPAARNSLQGGTAARTGIVMDNLLLYVTGGIAAGHFKTDWTNAFGGFSNVTTVNEWRWGWVAGFGTEWAWTPNVSIKSEVLYVDFVDRERGVLFGGELDNFTNSDSAWISRIGLNVKFGGPPVVARY